MEAKEHEHGHEHEHEVGPEAENESDADVKLNNPKSALSYLEISQLRNQKLAPVISATAPSVSTSAADKYFCNNCNRNNHVYNIIVHHD